MNGCTIPKQKLFLKLIFIALLYVYCSDDGKFSTDISISEVINAIR